ncbi:CBS domain-containing protein [Enhydrobacter aerosaccus]|uniref:CBS domain-containing protein n=1 Tax=Enhydrobacter aerosaccus TaxID=225324 RepID=A0A1T4T306_9HYPH|nr:CBS domain-containing protein [Enhydrobacter aerosaccus]SKA34900.1 CBS domain-containing protein [Enhydrobacter aerosaccus]
MQVSDVMTTNVATISPYASVCEAAQKMDDLNVGALPVCNGERLVGLITDRDIVVRSTAAGESPVLARVHEVMTDDICWCFEDDSVEKVEQEMAYMQIRRMPVVDRAKRLVGVVSLGDLITERAPGTDDALRSISEPSEQDRDQDFDELGGRYAGEPSESYRNEGYDYLYGTGGYGDGGRRYAPNER